MKQDAFSLPPFTLAGDRVMRVYLAGPMTGIEDHNFPAFHAYDRLLTSEGYFVVNPADHGVIEGAEWADYLRYDLARLATCEYAAFMPGWEKSRGAQLEHATAKTLGMSIFYLEELETA